MRRSDTLTGIGLVVGSILLLWAMSNGSSLLLFWDLPSVAITIGGSFCAVLIAIDNTELKRILAVLKQSFKNSNDSKADIILQFSELSKRARREGLLSLEDEISRIEDEFLKKGLQMVVDGIEPETIGEILELEINEMESRHKSGAGIFQTWGAFAPAFGMIGTLIGLIQMLSNLTDSSTIASGMGKALITTFYGTILANLVCIPIANNLNKKTAIEVSIREMMVEGILSIQSGVNPRIVEEKLITYLTPKERLEYLNRTIENSEGVV